MAFVKIYNSDDEVIDSGNYKIETRDRTFYIASEDDDFSYSLDFRKGSTPMKDIRSLIYNYNWLRLYYNGNDVKFHLRQGQFNRDILSLIKKADSITEQYPEIERKSLEGELNTYLNKVELIDSYIDCIEISSHEEFHKTSGSIYEMCYRFKSFQEYIPKKKDFESGQNIIWLNEPGKNLWACHTSYFEFINEKYSIWSGLQKAISLRYQGLDFHGDRQLNIAIIGKRNDVNKDTFHKFCEELHKFKHKKIIIGRSHELENIYYIDFHRTIEQTSQNKQHII